MMDADDPVINLSGLDNRSQQDIDKDALFIRIFGAPQNQLIVMILSFMLKRRVSYDGIDDTIQFIYDTNPAAKETQLLRISTYHVRQFYLKKYYYEKKKYCTGCSNILSNHTECDNASCVTKKAPPSFFLYFPIKQQVECMFKRKRFRELIINRSQRKKNIEENIESIADGSVYKYNLDILNEPNAFSLCYYSDGVSLYNSTRSSVWPLFLNYNELPTYERYKMENTIMAGLWYDGTKPNFNTFWAPHEKFLIELREVGIPIAIKETNSTINIRGLLLNGQADAPCRAMLISCMQYNSSQGCSFCLQTAKKASDYYNHLFSEYPELAKKNKDKPVAGTDKNYLVYYYEENVPLRTSAGTIADAEKAEKNKTPVNGVKGKSILSTLVPQYIESLSHDVMHGVYSGHGGKKMLQLWFSKTYEKENYSVSKIKICKSANFVNKTSQFCKQAP